MYLATPCNSASQKKLAVKKLFITFFQVILFDLSQSVIHIIVLTVFYSDSVTYY